MPAELTREAAAGGAVGFDVAGAFECFSFLFFSLAVILHVHILSLQFFNRCYL